MRGKVYCQRPLLPRLLPRPCFRRHSRLLCAYLGAPHAPLLRTCLGELATREDGEAVHFVWLDDTPGQFDIFYRRGETD